MLRGNNFDDFCHICGKAKNLGHQAGNKGCDTFSFKNYGIPKITGSKLLVNNIGRNYRELVDHIPNDFFKNPVISTCQSKRSQKMMN